MILLKLKRIQVSIGTVALAGVGAGIGNIFSGLKLSYYNTIFNNSRRYYNKNSSNKKISDELIYNMITSNEEEKKLLKKNMSVEEMEVRKQFYKWYKDFNSVNKELQQNFDFKKAALELRKEKFKIYIYKLNKKAGRSDIWLKEQQNKFDYYKYKKSLSDFKDFYHEYYKIYFSNLKDLDHYDFNHFIEFAKKRSKELGEDEYNSAIMDYIIPTELMHNKLVKSFKNEDNDKFIEISKSIKSYHEKFKK